MDRDVSMIMTGVLIHSLLLLQIPALSNPGNEPIPGRGQSAMSAKEWMEELLTAPPGGALPGVPVTLSASLQGIRGDRQLQEVIDAYWHLTKAVAKYYASAHVYRVAQAEVDRFGLSVSQESMQSIATLRLEAARTRLAAVEAQANLALLIRWTGDTLPLPASRPHVGAYRTRYDEIFAKQPNRQARRLHHVLPNEVELIQAHTAMLNALASGTKGQVADAARFQTECGDFLDAVNEYNRHIAHYVLLVIQDDSDGSEIVPMLIKVTPEEMKKSRVADGRNGSTSRTAPYHEDFTQNKDEKNRSAVVPAHAEEEIPAETGQERSILVRPETIQDRGPAGGNKLPDHSNPMRDTQEMEFPDEDGWRRQGTGQS